MIDQLNTGLLTELAVTLPVRATRSCPARQLVAAGLTEILHHFDALHAHALTEAVSATCLPR
ncbi:hypothetical protein GCM10029964_082790 [Kibdelosporangium lantanae]